MIMVVIKSITPLINKMVTLEDEKVKFKMKVKKESINNMTGLEFESFSAWFFEEVYGFNDIVITQATNDGGVDLIMTDNNGEKIYVECKRYNKFKKASKYEFNEDEEYDFIIGREICQKLVGAMTLNNIKKGIIMTTGDINKNALNYVEKLRENSGVDIKFITMEEIIEGFEKVQEDLDYSIEVEI